MLFNSYIFIFAFLPIALIGYYGLNHVKCYILAQVFLIAMSMWFYGYFNPSYLWLILTSILMNYVFHRILCRTKNRLLLIAGLMVNLGFLCYFKYYDFFVENFNAVFGTSFVLKHIMLPLGISFFTFQQLSFLIDTYKGETPQYSLIECMLFVSFFPQLVAGPIVTHDEMIRQFRNPEQKHLDMEWMSRGVMLFTLGLAKKVLLADTFGEAVDWGYNFMTVLDSTNALLVSLFYTLQLYFDFSGYCNMAKGIGLMLHIDIADNFNSPYQAVGIVDFWRRWHMTLGRFFTKYVYIPLGGSRKGKLRKCLNSMCVFFLSGLWHGANWTFVIWGLLHGVGYIFDFLGKKIWDKVPRFVMRLLTFFYVNLAFVAFRAGSVQEMLNMYRAIFAGKFGAPLADLTDFFNRDELWLTIQFLNFDRLPYAKVYSFVLIMGLSLYLVLIGKNAEERVGKCKFGILSASATAFLFLYSVMCLSGVSSFLYFNF